MITRESDMSPIIEKWLREQGCTQVWSEVPWHHKRIDLIGKARKKYFVVELKMSLTDYLMEQTATSGGVGHHTYCAVATRPEHKSFQECVRRKIGIISCVDGRADEILYAPCIPPVFCGDFHKKLERMVQGGTAGCPNTAGNGAVQKLMAEVEKYRASRPKADWRELFEQIPNPYKTRMEMKKALTLLIKRRDWEQAGKALRA